MNAKIFSIVAFIFMMVWANLSLAQGPINDTISTTFPRDTTNDNAEFRSKKSTQATATDTSLKQRHSPRKATLLSMALPGAGQVYNKKYWKVPVVYAAAGGALYGVIFNTKYYNDFKDAYKERLATGSNTDPQYSRLQTETLQSARDYYRYYRDLSYIGLGAVYILQIIDASVDAHFFDFKITEDLSLHVTPTVVPLPQTASTQLLFTVKF